MTSADEILDAAGMPHPLPAGVHRGQARMAYRLAQSYAGRLMYVHGLGWQAWSGCRWVEDHHGLAKRAVLEVLREALSQSLDDHDQGLRADVRKCESSAGVNGVLDLASALEPFAFTVHDLDADPHLLNTPSGTLDLRTHVLRPADPSDRITKVTRGSYNPEVTSPEWSTFLAEVLPDLELRGFVQRLAGVSLLGVVREQILAIFTGSGANGKGVFYGALGNALGDYATVAEPDLFMHREGAHPTGEMDLRGVRLVVVSESDKNRRLAEATMKRLTGGDEIRARRMRKDFVSFKPSHTPVLVTNHLPKVSGDDPALWRRMRVVPFSVVIPEGSRDPRLAERLELAADAIVTWAVDGYRDYAQRGRLEEPEQVLAATGRYERESDAVARFLAECTVQDRNARVTTAAAFERWCRWIIRDGADPLSMKAFGQALDRRGYQATKSTGGQRLRHGIGVVPEEPQSND